MAAGTAGLARERRPAICATTALGMKLALTALIRQCARSDLTGSSLATGSGNGFSSLTRAAPRWAPIGRVIGMWLSGPQWGLVTEKADLSGVTCELRRRFSVKRAGDRLPAIVVQAPWTAHPSRSWSAPDDRHRSGHRGIPNGLHPLPKLLDCLLARARKFVSTGLTVSLPLGASLCGE